jgi:hypothetical protein
MVWLLKYVIHTTLWQRGSTILLMAPLPTFSMLEIAFKLKRFYVEKAGCDLTMVDDPRSRDPATCMSMLPVKRRCGVGRKPRRRVGKPWTKALYSTWFIENLTIPKVPGRPREKPRWICIYQVQEHIGVSMARSKGIQYIRVCDDNRCMHIPSTTNMRHQSVVTMVESRRHPKTPKQLCMGHNKHNLVAICGF